MSDDRSPSATGSSDGDLDGGSTPPSDIDDDDDNEENEIVATQQILAKYADRVDQGNTPAESGILEEVELKNFMCHEDMQYKLGPLINFICGKNGSGKSAILTAIVLCLGGKASATNRGGRLQDFIKGGKDHASIVCKIRNQGDGAYMPEEYGQTIQIERHFSRAGASGFKLKSEKGRIISTKRSDLDDICDHFALQIDNPMNVLSQDQARQFISTSSASEKYKLFVKGVQLEQLDQDYRLIEEQLDNIEAKIEAKRPDIQILEQRMERAKIKLAHSQKHDSILDKLRDYRRQLAWAQVAQQEETRDMYARQIEEADAKIAEEEARIVALDNAFQEADRVYALAFDAHNQAEAEVQRVQDEKKEEQARHDEIKKEVVEAQAEHRAIRSAVTEAKAVIDAKGKAIQEEQQRLAELDGGGATRRLEALEQAKERVMMAIQEQREHQALKAQRERDIDQAQTAMDEADEIRTAKTAEVEDQKRNVENMMKNRALQDLGYHANMPQLLRALQQEKGFREQPIGPIGKHVKLLKPEWSSILEKAFGNGLNGFIVTSKQDMDLLSRMMKRVGCHNLPITIANNQPIDTRPHEPDPRFDTVLRVLDIDHEAVRKQLVIHYAIEQCILIPDMTEASEVLYRSGTPLHNVKRCYSFSPNNSRKGAVLFYRNGQAAQDPVHEFVGTPRMKTDIEAQIRQQQEILQNSREQLIRLEEDFRVARDKHGKAKQALVRHSNQERDLRIAVQQAEDEVERLNEEIKEDNVEGGRLSVLRQQLAEAEEQKALHEDSFADSLINLDEKKNRLREATRSLNSFDERIAELQEVARNARAEAQEASKKRAHRLGEKNAAIARIDDAKMDRGTLERKQAEFDVKVASYIEQARQVCERVNLDPGESFASLDKKYQRLLADYQKSQQQIGGTREQIAADAARTSEAYKKGLKDLRQLESLAMKLKGSLIERRERWKKFRSYISVRAKAQFRFLLSQRSFRGEIITDHKQKLLDLRVEPDITKRDGAGRGTRTLSGGEKSFSQICLLLAIWEAMGSPIRCLDEFDVFMDAVNRNTSVNLLIEGARQSIGRQFILISPGTKTDIKRASDVNAIE